MPVGHQQTLSLLLVLQLRAMAQVQDDDGNGPPVINITNCSFHFNMTLEEYGYSDIIYYNKTTNVRTGLIYSLISWSGRDSKLSVAAEWAALLAVRDFNQRVVSSLDSHVDESTGDGAFFNLEELHDCNFQLEIQFDSYANLMKLGEDFQTHVLLLNETHQHPMAILGGVSSDSSALLATLGAVAIRPFVEISPTCQLSWTAPANSIMNISPISASASLDDRGRFPYFARTIPSSSGDAEALCRYLKNIGVKQLAVLYQLDIYEGQFFYLGMTEAAAKYGIQLHSFPFGDSFGDSSASLRQSVSLLKSTPLRYVYCVGKFGAWNDLLTLLTEYEILGIDSKSKGEGYVWFFDYVLLLDINGGLISERLYPQLDRSIILNLQVPIKSYEIQQQQFRRASRDSNFLQAWDESHAFQKLLNDTDNMPQAPDASLFSLLTYDSVWALGLAACKVNATRFPSSSVYKNLRGMTFTGMTGLVKFDPQTASRSPTSVSYELQNLFFRPNDTLTLLPKVQISTQGDVLSSVVTFSPLIFPSGSTSPPSDLAQLPFVLVQKTPTSALIFLWILISVALLLSVACAAWTVKQRKHPKVRAAQPFFLFFLCCGTFLVAFSTIFLTWGEPMPIDALNFACVADPWFLFIGLTTIFAALFAKTWRIDRVYRNAKAFRRVTVRAQDVLWPFLVLLSLNLIVLIVWTVKYPMAWTEVAVEQDYYNRATVIRYTCYPEDASAFASEVCLYVLLALSGCSLLLLNFESYRARHLPSEFNETTYIAITNLVLLEALLICLPMLVASRNQGTGFIMIRSLLNFIICLGVLLPTFIPKFTNYRHDKDRRTLRTMSHG